MKALIWRLIASVGTVALTAVSVPAMASIIAQDNFSVPPYALGALNGQAVGGTGFTGTWTHFLGQDLSVVAGGVGRPTVTDSSAGDYANFASPLTLGTGQLFVSYTIDNVDSTTLSSTRLDLNRIGGDRALLGGFDNGAFALRLESGLGTAVAQSSVTDTGAHKIVGVLDAMNDQIAIFVDPTSSSFYNANGANDADAVAAWVPSGGLSFGSYSLVENLQDQVNFGDVLFSTDPFSAGIGVPEPASMGLLASGLLVLGLIRRRNAV